MNDADDRRQPRFEFDRHASGYRDQFAAITRLMQSGCPIAWSDTYGGHWVAAGAREVFDLARTPQYLSNDHDVRRERRGYQGVSIPAPVDAPIRGGFLEMDPPEQRYYRQLLNPYLSPAAVARWVPVVDELARACLDEKIEAGRIDFVDDLANVVPAVLTLAMMGIPLRNWTIYCEPSHAGVYTPPGSPDAARVRELQVAMFSDLYAQFSQIREKPRPGIVSAVAGARIDGVTPDDLDLLGVLALVIGGGFDTTTALTAHALEWLSDHPAERSRLSSQRATLLDSATEEFLRFFTPAPGDGRTVSADCALAGARLAEGERVYLSWAMANRDPSVFTAPDEVDLARTGNRHFSFGLGIHRCLGSNMARMVFKRMLLAVFDRMPDFQVDAARTVHYDSVGVIQGMKHLPATFTPGTRIGPGLEETVEAVQRACDAQRLAEPVTTRARKEHGGTTT